nr:metallo-beta-lactamase domain-containing protein 1-like isoform X1 [Biomphalaria glabrata]
MRQKDEDALQRKVLREKKKVTPSWTQKELLDHVALSHLLKGPHRNIIVNTGNPWERDLLLKALSDQGLKPEDIHYVICLNGHIEQIGNLNLFSRAVQCVGYDICRHDQYLLHELKEGIYFIVKVTFSPPPFG